MQLNKLLHSTGVRLSFTYALIFSLSTCFLFSLVYITSSKVLSDRTKSSIEHELTKLIASGHLEATKDLSHHLEILLESRNEGNFRYLIVNNRGVKVAGDLRLIKLTPGWNLLDTNQWMNTPENSLWSNDTVKSHQLMLLTKTLSNGITVSVGQDIFWLNDVEDQWVDAFLWSVALTLLFAIIGGVIIGRAFFKRIDNINHTTRTIMNGNLSARIPLNGTEDELDQLGENINEMLGRLQRSMEDIRQVSNNIAHDLRTPLNRVRQRLESSLLEAKTINEYESNVNQAIDDIDNSLEIFNAILRISNIESGERRSHFTHFNLSALLEDLTLTYMPVADDMKRSMNTSLARNVWVRADRELLTQLFVNLMENALHYSNDGCLISVILDETNKVAKVLDNGPGIPETARSKVFERFYRVDASRSKPGNGMGLALVAAIAELHNTPVKLIDNQPGLGVVIDLTNIIVPETDK